MAVWSDVRYTPDDLASVENLSMHIASLTAAFAKDRPDPPHMDASGKELYSLVVSGWYAKGEDGVYGVVEVYWRYYEQMPDEYVLYDYADALYILYEPGFGGRVVERDALSDSPVSWGVPSEPLGVGREMPLC